MGTAVQAMILNALGFSGRALYLSPQFYRNRPVDVLLGEGIEAEDLHNDCLGTALDALYEYGVTELFYQLASQALGSSESKIGSCIWTPPPSVSTGPTERMKRNPRKRHRR